MSIVISPLHGGIFVCKTGVTDGFIRFRIPAGTRVVKTEVTNDYNIHHITTVELECYSKSITEGSSGDRDVTKFIVLNGMLDPRAIESDACILSLSNITNIRMSENSNNISELTITVDGLPELYSDFIKRQVDKRQVDK